MATSAIWACFFSNELAQSLSKKGKSLQVVDIESLKPLMMREALDVQEWSDAPTARWLAGKSGAYLVVVGFLVASGDFMSLRVSVERVSDGKVITVTGTKIPRTPELDTLFSTAAKGFPVAIEFPGGETPLPAGVLRPGKNGVGYPECVDCSDPHFTQAARDAKFGGTILSGIPLS